MNSVIRYLKDPSNNVMQCDFRPFNTHIKEIPVLAEFLEQNTCKVRAIAISRLIPEEAKASLAAAMGARANLKV